MAKRVTTFSLLSGCSLLMAIGLVSAPVQAGFEWVPAGEAPPAIQKPQEVIIPEPEYVEPTVTHMGGEENRVVMQHIAVVPEEGQDEHMPMPVTDEAPAEEVVVSEETEPMVESTEVVEAEVIEPAEEVKEEVVVYEETMPQKAYALAYGFGKEMPLALALRQIVPASYAFSFDPAVNIGTRVSWQGGEAWNVVLKKALMDKYLTAVVYDDMVFVRPATAADKAHVEAAVATMPAAEMPATEVKATAEPAPMVSEVAQPAYLDAAHSWSATSGQTLRSVLSEWSDKVGVQLHWENVYDYAIVSDWSYDGDYVHAVDGILTAFEGETPKPVGRLHPNAPTGPVILVVDVKNAQ